MKNNFQGLMNGIPYEIVSKRVAAAVSDENGEKIDLSWAEIENYAEVKDHLTIQLVGREGNKEVLEQLPHHDMEDLAIIYRIRLQENTFGTVFAAVTNAMLERYGITAEQLHRDAVESASLHQPFKIRTMAEMFNELCEGLSIPEDTFPMYVATNAERINGAGVLAYPDFMETAAEYLKGSFYILPSSIHEVILLPEKSDFSVHELQMLVQSVNADEVAPEERLSNYVYHYDRKKRLFERADKYEARIRRQRNEQKKIRKENDE